MTDSACVRARASVVHRPRTPAAPLTRDSGAIARRRRRKINRIDSDVVRDDVGRRPPDARGAVTDLDGSKNERTVNPVIAAYRIRETGVCGCALSGRSARNKRRDTRSIGGWTEERRDDLHGWTENGTEQHNGPYRRHRAHNPRWSRLIAKRRDEKRNPTVE
jgi:hypothetical protein